MKLKKMSAIALATVAMAYAEDSTFVRNICDTLPSSKTPIADLRLTQVEETLWYGSKDLSKKDSGKVTVYTDYKKLTPFRNQFSRKLPVSIKAGCAETKNNLFVYGEWSSGKWSENSDNNDYATYIMDINQVEFPGYSASNSCNILAMRKGSLPTDGSYKADELMVSRTFELKFDWWYSLASYFVVNTKTEDGKETSVTSYSYGSAVAMDSASAVANAIKSLKVPDSVSKVSIQLLHGVLEDANKVSSSSSVASSSSATPGYSCGVDTRLSCDYQPMQSSSSEETTSLVELRKSLWEKEGTREIRRLDGTRVRNSETLVPGVYYVKGLDGRWKKQVELPR